MQLAGENAAAPALSTPDFVKVTASGVAWNTTCTVAFTPAAGSDRCVFMFAAWTQDNDISGMTFDGNAMASRDTASGSGMDGAMYSYCTNLGTSEVNVVATIDGAGAIDCWVVQVDGCNTTDPVDTQDDDIAHLENPVEVETTLTTSTNNCLLLSGVGIAEDDTNDITVCNTTGQELLGESSISGSAAIDGGYIDHDTAGEKSQCFDMDDVESYEAIGITVAIKPAGS